MSIEQPELVVPDPEREREEYKKTLVARAQEFFVAQASDQAEEITPETFVSDEDFGAILDQNKTLAESPTKLFGTGNYYKLNERGEKLATLRYRFFKEVQNEMLRGALKEKFEKAKADLLKIIENTKREIRANPPMIARDITFSMVTPGGSEAVVSMVNNMFLELDGLAKLLENSDINTADSVENMLDEITSNIEYAIQAMDECYKLDMSFHDVPAYATFNFAAMIIGPNLRSAAVETWLNNEKYHQFRYLRPNFIATKAAKQEPLFPAE